MPKKNRAAKPKRRAKPASKRTPAKTGRPIEHHTTKAGRERAFRLASKGASYGSIGRALGMDPKTFKALRERDEDLAAAIELGRDELETVLVSTLFLAATRKKAPYLPGAMFLLKALRGYRDRGDAPAGPAVAVSINLPEPLSPAAYASMVSVVDGKRLPLPAAEAEAHHRKPPAKALPEPGPAPEGEAVEGEGADLERD